MKKKAILAVSFGTSYLDSREKTLEVIEHDLAKAFPEYEVRCAYTSSMIIRKLKTRDGIHIDNVEEALTRMVQDGFEQVLVQATHVIPGEEYHKMLEMIAPFRTQFDALVCGEPLLAAEADYRAVAGILGRELAEVRNEKTDIVLMGHGSEHQANEAYQYMQEILREETLTDFLMGTVEAVPTADDVIRLVEERQPQRVILTPFMIVAGDHANQDMAGDDEDSWKCRFEQAGYPATCLIKGLGEYPDIRRIFIEHASTALHKFR
ncbi:MAG: sirohydrochlorin cobaltochelatase [Lachnospiraceae bacterium]